MKKILLFISIIAFYGCEKCATCTRTWTYRTSTIGSNGQTIGLVSTSNGDKEVFDVCDGDAIDNEQRPIKTHSEVKDGNNTIVTDGDGECSCNVH